MPWVPCGHANEVQADAFATAEKVKEAHGLHWPSAVM